MRINMEKKNPRKTPLVGKLVSLFLPRGFCESFFVAGQDFTSIGPMGFRNQAGFDNSWPLIAINTAEGPLTVVNSG